jgi:hypothetical protein
MLADRIKVTTATTGTGALTLGSTGVRDSTNGDFLAPAEVPAICGRLTSYFITSGGNWCSGQGALSSNGLTLTRDPGEMRWNGTTYAQGLLSLTGTSTVIISPRGADLGAATVGVTSAVSTGLVAN